MDENLVQQILAALVVESGKKLLKQFLLEIKVLLHGNFIILLHVKHHALLYSIQHALT